MEPNNLVVTVHGARGLSVKGQTELDAFVTLVLQGKSSLRSKTETEEKRTTGDVQWNEGCEFKLMEGAARLTATVQHRTRVGRAELIGKAELVLDEIRNITAPTWFPLQKKSKDEKYRGELCLSFAFSFTRPKMSISNLSLNTIPKDSVLKRMKRKMGLKERTGADSDALSTASAFPAMRSNRLSLDGDSELNKAFTRGSSIRMSQRNPRHSSENHSVFHNPEHHSDHYMREPRDLVGNPSLPPSSPYLSPAHGQSSLSTANSFSNLSASIPRPPSAGSSGFGSRGQEGPLETNQEWHLASEVDRLRAELAVKDSRLRDMEEYVDRLLTKVMDAHPELLASSPSTLRKSNRRLIF